MATLAMNAAAAEKGNVTATPLRPPRPESGAVMKFSPMSPEATGVVTENRFADPRMWGDRYQEITYGAIGTGVAVGDYDNDGRPDVFIVSKTEQSRLFRNLGDWRFEDVTAAAGLAGARHWWDDGLDWIRGKLGSERSPEDIVWQQGASFADIDNDGDLDLYVCRFDAPNLLFINQGNGTFVEEAAARGLAIRDASGMAAFSDFDRDGWLDVYVQTNLLDAGKQPNGRADYLYRNRGDGTFENVTEAAGIRGESAGHSAVWWDYDQDLWPDLYVANDFATSDRLYRNNRDGTFTDVIHATVPHLPYYAMGADLGDIDNDGLLDFFVADMAATSHVKEQRGMAGSRARTQAEPAEPREAPQVMRNALYLNTGAGRLLEAAELAGVPATDWTWSVRFEDLDNDGRVDLHVTNGMNREYHNSDLLARIMAAENLAEPRRIMQASPPMAEANLAFHNQGNLRFASVGKAWGLDQRGVSFGSAFADLDGDGDMDLVFGNYEQGATVLRNDAPAGGRLLVGLQGKRSNRFGIGAIVTLETKAGLQTRQMTLARGYLSAGEPVVHFGLGTEPSIDRLTVRWPSGAVQTLTDVAVNQRLVLQEPADVPKEANATSTESKRETLFEDTTAARQLPPPPSAAPSDLKKLQPLVPFDLNRQGPHLAAADLNGDQRDDLVVSGTLLEPARVYLSDGEGAFESPAVPWVNTPRRVDDGPVLAFDANGDGRSDLLVTKSGVREPLGDAYQPQLWQNDGSGSFAPSSLSLPKVPISVGTAVAADFNRDGRLDLFLGGRSIPGAYPLSPRSAVWLNQASGFEDATSASTGLEAVGMVNAALATDVDQDGWVDLLLAIEWGGIQYWRNEQGRAFRDASAGAGFAAAGTGWWTSLSTGDFNHDGRLDYVAGNVGSNTPYEASPEQPALLYFGQFGASGDPVIVEAVHENERTYPRRTRNELAPYLPALLRRYARNDAYARATMDDVFGGTLAQARRFEATEFRSGVFLSRPDGTYQFSPLPAAAQLAPLQGISTGDFDGDGQSDILAVQNMFSPAPVTGRFDGGLGLLLRGNGDGTFLAVRADESGIVVPGDGEALVVGQFGDERGPEWIVSRARESLVALRAQPPREARWLSVRLAGSGGNPSAIGAQLTLVQNGRATAMAEISAGSSYASQSAAAAFFLLSPERASLTLQVRWPDGSTTTHEVPPEGGTLILNTSDGGSSPRALR